MFTRLALGFALVLAAAALALPGSASADYRSPANLARTASIDYAAYVVRRGPYGRTCSSRTLLWTDRRPLSCTLLRPDRRSAGPLLWTDRRSLSRTLLRSDRCSAWTLLWTDGRSPTGLLSDEKIRRLPPSDRQAPAAPTVKWCRCLRLFGVQTRVPNAQLIGTSGAAPLATGPYRWPIAIFQFHGL